MASKLCHCFSIIKNGGDRDELMDQRGNCGQ